MGPTQWRAHRKHPAARRSLASLGLLSGCAADRLRRFVYSSVAYRPKSQQQTLPTKQLKTRTKRCNHKEYADTISCYKGRKCDDTHQYCSNTNECFHPRTPVASKQPTCVENKRRVNKVNRKLMETVRGWYATGTTRPIAHRPSTADAPRRRCPTLHGEGGASSSSGQSSQ